jgi:hypothetical protein
MSFTLPILWDGYQDVIGGGIHESETIRYDK